jgi:hypothetical protein
MITCRLSSVALVAALATTACATADPADAGDADAGDAAYDSGAGDAAAAGHCPESIPWVHFASPLACDPGLHVTDCAYAAPGCADGARPANVCRCSKGQWQCDEPFRTCLPVPSQAAPGEPIRPLPPERVPQACSDPADEPAGAVCSPARPSSSPDTCASNADCAAAEVCLDGWSDPADGGTYCSCHPVDCLTDADCGATQACTCGTTSSAESCGLIFNARCGHACVPALCRDSADCGAGGICSPSADHGEVIMFACHDPSKDECFSDEECFADSICHYDMAVGGWTCYSPGVL